MECIRYHLKEWKVSTLSTEWDHQRVTEEIKWNISLEWLSILPEICLNRRQRKANKLKSDIRIQLTHLFAFSYIARSERWVGNSMSLLSLQEKNKTGDSDQPSPITGISSSYLMALTWFKYAINFHWTLCVVRVGNNCFKFVPSSIVNILYFTNSASMLVWIKCLSLSALYNII